MKDAKNVIHQDLKFEKVLMTIIAILMAFVAFIIKDMHSDFKEVVKTASQNQIELHTHIHDKRAHLPDNMR